MDLSKQFDSKDKTVTYKGVVLRKQGSQTGRKDLSNYSFEYRWNAPVGQRYGAQITENTPRKWITDAEEGPLNKVRGLINSYLEQGFTVHPSGHMRAPGHPE